MNSARLNIFVRAIKIKLDRGEKIEDILASYVKLTEEEIGEIRDNLEL